MASRVGLTTRVIREAAYDESRDALASDWHRFMARALPELRWMALPNLGGDIVDYVEAWELDGFILTGGNDPGTVPERDETESALLDLAAERGFPVLGVCRGLQMMQRYYHGELSSCVDDVHVARRHQVRFTGDANGLLADTDAGEVNSYHRYGFVAEETAAPLTAFALASDGIVEGVVHRELPFVSVMWHPEREREIVGRDRTLVRNLFRLEA